MRWIEDVSRTIKVPLLLLYMIEHPPLQNDVNKYQEDEEQDAIAETSSTARCMSFLFGLHFIWMFFDVRTKTLDNFVKTHNIERSVKNLACCERRSLPVGTTDSFALELSTRPFR